LILLWIHLAQLDPCITLAIDSGFMPLAQLVVKGHSMRSACVAFGTLASLLASASAATFELNSFGSFSYNGISALGTTGVITNVGQRALDDAMLERVRDAMTRGVNGYSPNLTPVAVALDVTITLDELKVNTADDMAGYPGSGWHHDVRYNGALDGWRVVYLIGREYSPDSGFNGMSYQAFDVSTYDSTYLSTNLPFYRESEARNDTSSYGTYAIADSMTTTWFTINGSWLEMENTYMLARTVGDTLEIGAAWGFHEQVTVPTPGVLTAVAVGLCFAGRRRRA
jgi:hypothetical protein